MLSNGHDSGTYDNSHEIDPAMNIPFPQDPQQYYGQSQNRERNESGRRNNSKYTENPGFLVEPERIYYSQKDIHMLPKGNEQDIKESLPTQESERNRNDDIDERLMQNDDKDQS